MAAYRKFSIGWKKKAFAFNWLDRLPGGNFIYYLLQRYITKTIPRFRSPSHGSLHTWKKHHRAITATGAELAKLRLLEIGAGWDLYQNIVFYMMGLEQQYLFDVRRWVKPELVNQTIAWLRAHPPAGYVRLPARQLDPRRFEAELQQFLGITYVAPMTTERLPVPPGSIDLIVTTSVFEHIPATALPGVLADFRRVLAPGGLMSHVIDYSDHYAHSDPKITGLNYCRFSPEEWQRYNPGIHYQNRLRHPEYRQLFQDAGFDIAEDNTWQEQAEIVRGELLHPDFARFALEDLAILGTHMVLRPQ